MRKFIGMPRVGVPHGPKSLGVGAAGGGFKGEPLVNDELVWLEYRLWKAQTQGNDYSMVKAANDVNEMRFEVRQGDTASSGHRSELTGEPWFALPSARWNVKAQLLVESGPKLSSWCLLHQIHQDDLVGSSPTFAIELNTDDTVSIVTRNNSGVATYHTTSLAPIVRGTRYLLAYAIDIKGTTGDNILNLTMTAPDGSIFLSVNATAQNIGYDAARFNYVKLGVYIDDQPETIAVRWRNFSCAFGTTTALPTTANARARTLPEPFYDGLSVPPTWCVSSSFHCLDAWTGLAYEHGATIGKVDYIYDQSNRGWDMGNATDASRPADGFSRYLLAPYYDAASKFLNVFVDNDTSDLLDGARFFIVAIVQPIGVPANNGATGGGTVNNNPLIFGENSGARNFGITTRDNGSGANGPHDAQFFVKDSIGEKSTGVAASLQMDRPNLILCEHNGSQITMSVNGGAWSTPVTCGAMVATTGFPRSGHCGTSYQGDVVSLATFKTVPSTADKALLMARFAAMRTALGF